MLIQPRFQHKIHAADIARNKHILILYPLKLRNILAHPDPPPLRLPRPPLAISMTGQTFFIVHMRPEPDPCEQERIPGPHARQPQHKRHRAGKEQQEGYVVEIPVPDWRAVDEDVQIKFLEQLPGE